MTRQSRDIGSAPSAFSRRIFLAMSATGAISALATACGSSSAPSATPVSTVASAITGTGAPGAPTVARSPTVSSAAGAVKTGGELIIAHTPFDSMSPVLSLNDAAHWVHSQIYDSLIVTNTKRQTGAGLAESWKANSDTEYQFTLRRGVQWHDDNEIFPKGKSRAVTAQDVKFTYDLLLDPKTASPKSSFLTSVAAVTVVDDQTLTITTKTADAFFLGQGGITGVPILPHEAFEKYGKDGIGDKAVGSGPFKLQEYVPSERIVLARNDGYWIKPNLDRVTFRIIPDPNVRLASLRSKETDVLPILPPKEIAGFKSDSQYTTFGSFGLPGVGTGSLWYFILNTEAAPFNDSHVRQAVAVAPDWNSLAADSYGVTATRVYGVVGEGMVGYNGDALKKYWEGGPEKAKAILEQAGWAVGSDGIREKDGQKLKATVLAGNSAPERAKAAVILQAVLKPIGFDLQVQTVETSVVLQNGRSGNFQMSSTGGGSSDNGLLFLLHSSGIGSSNQSRYKNPEVDKLLDQAKATLDSAKRAPLWSMAEDLAMADYPLLPFCRTFDIGAAKATVHDYPGAFFSLGLVRDDNNVWKG